MKRKLVNLLLSLIAVSVLTFNSAGVLAVTPESRPEGSLWFEESGGLTIPMTDLKTRPARSDDGARSAQEAPNLPAKYDLRDLGGRNYVTPVKIQSPWGVCWSFACISSIETNLLLKGVQLGDGLSERAIANYTNIQQGAKWMPPEDYEGISLQPFQPPVINLPLRIGGDFYSVGSEASTWNGANTEAQAPYRNNEAIARIGSNQDGGASRDRNVVYSPDGIWDLPYSQIYNGAYHIQNVEYFDNHDVNYSIAYIDSLTNDVKESMLKYGAAAVGYRGTRREPYYHSETASQYIPSPLTANHAVSIVGWDDDYPVENFGDEYRPPAPGAWIIKNSWGTDFGEDGYFYLSYYDQTIRDFALFEAESPETGYSYDNNYEYDFSGDKMYVAQYTGQMLGIAAAESQVDPSAIKMANIFTAAGHERLDAVSTYTYYQTPTKVTTWVYLLEDGAANPEDGELVLTQVDNLTTEGFHTLKLETPIELSPGQNFAVVQNTVYYDVRYMSNPTTPVVADLPGISIECGLKYPLLAHVDDGTGHYATTATRIFTAQAMPDKSFVYGLKGDLGVDEPEWVALSDKELRNELTDFFEAGDYAKDEIPMTGDAMIKAYTVNLDGETTDITPAEDFSICGGATQVNLATTNAGEGAVTSTELVVSPVSGPVTWSADSGAVAKLSTATGDTTTISSVAEGETTVTATMGGRTATIKVVVSDRPFTVGGVDFALDGSGNRTVTVRNVAPNPALAEGGPVQKVTAISDADPATAIEVTRVPGTSDWTFQIPAASDQSGGYDIYASTDADSQGYLIKSVK